MIMGILIGICLVGTMRPVSLIAAPVSRNRIRSRNASTPSGEMGCFDVSAGGIG